MSQHGTQRFATGPKASSGRSEPDPSTMAGTDTDRRRVLGGLVAGVGATLSFPGVGHAASGMQTTNATDEPAVGQAASDHPPIGVRAIATGAEGIFRNTFAVETEEGFVVVDAPFRRSDSAMAREWFTSQGKPILAVLVTHMHPDHTFGLTELLKGADAPIVATRTVARAIEAAEDQLQSLVPNVIGSSETERDRRFPDWVVGSGETVSFGGTTFKVDDVGAVESAADSIWSLPDHPDTLFVGDLVYHDIHSWVAQGATARYIEALDALHQTTAPSTRLYPGHGAIVTPAAIPQQVAYLRAYRTAVAEIAGGRPRMSDREKERLVARMIAYQPSPVLSFAIAFGADAVATELAETMQ